MAKSKNRVKGRRVVLSNAKRSLPSPMPSVRLSPLTILEDRRQFHPERAYRPALSFSGRPHTLTTVQRPATARQLQSPSPGWRAPSQTKAIVAFHAPDRVLVCVRRERRKEVLFAKRKAGKSGQRKPKFNWLSSVSCRRK